MSRVLTEPSDWPVSSREASTMTHDIATANRSSSPLRVPVDTMDRHISPMKMRTTISRSSSPINWNKPQVVDRGTSPVKPEKDSLIRDLEKCHEHCDLVMLEKQKEIEATQRILESQDGILARLKKEIHVVGERQQLEKKKQKDLARIAALKEKSADVTIRAEIDAMEATIDPGVAFDSYSSDYFEEGPDELQEERRPHYDEVERGVDESIVEDTVNTDLTKEEVEEVEALAQEG